MKNIADVNSDDILTELNNLDYDESDDLQLLDDEDIKVVKNNNTDELSDFYVGYNSNTNNSVDLFTEQPKSNNTIKVETPKIEIKKDTIEEKPSVIQPSSIDSYLNREKVTPVSKPNTPTYSEPIRQVPVNNQKINNSSESQIKSVQPAINPKTNNMDDLNQLFNKVSNNVKGASEIVNRNVEIKRKIDDKINELKRLQQEHESIKKKDIEEINAYKDEVYTKLQHKKIDMEKDLKELRDAQIKLEQERKDFETYKSNAMANLTKLEKELKDRYEDRNKNIEQIEKGLVKRKEQLDSERASIAKERQELADNLVKFNKLVSEFTQGMDGF